MFAAPFDMERALLHACVSGDKIALAEFAEENAVFMLNDHVCSTDELLSRIHEVRVQTYTIDLLRVEYDASECRYIKYVTEMVTTLPDGRTGTSKYSVSTKWELAQDNYRVRNVQINK